MGIALGVLYFYHGFSIILTVWIWVLSFIQSLGIYFLCYRIMKTLTSPKCT